MKPITFDNVCYRIDGQPVFMHSGEFHYFRVPRQDWRRRMELFRQAGGNCIATYVPWLLHEPREGTFVFDSENGSLNLEEFLRTARQVGLYVVARPGPYQYSELAEEGLASWLKKGYPELMARRFDGTIINGVSYVHPLFLEKVRTWFDQVCPILARHTVDRDGPIAFVQLDNELTGIHIWRGGIDYNPQAMGFGRADGRYARFLQARHGEIATLNRLYGTSYAGFGQVEPAPSPAQTGRAEDIRRAKDYFDFYLASCADYLAELAAMVRGHGITTPLMHNAGNPTMDAYFVETVRKLGREVLIGSDHYYGLGSNPRYNPTPPYAVEAFGSLETLRLLGFPPTVLEMPSGAHTDWPPITAEDCHAAYRMHIALGMKGVNYYIFTGGPNPPGTGITGEVYDYNAPIAADGTIRPLYHVQKEYGLWLAANPWLMETAAESDFRVGFDYDYARSERWWGPRGEVPVSAPEAWEFLREGVLFSAFSASLCPQLVDLDAEDWTGEPASPVFVASAAAMSAQRQRRIAAFLRAGGRVILAPVVPTLDENLQPCTILAELLGSPVQRAVGGPSRIAGVPNPGDARTFVTDNPPSGAEILGVHEPTGGAVAWRLGVPGGGEALVLGCRWQHRRNHWGHTLAALLGRMGVQPRVSCSNPYVWPILRTSGRRSMLFLLSLYSSPMDARVICRPSWSERAIDTGEHRLPPMTVKAVELNG